MNEENLEKFKQFLESFVRISYIMGKTEGLAGNKDNNAGEIIIPMDILKELITDISESEKTESEKPSEIGFNMPIAEKIEPPKIIITKEKEIELVKKYGKKQMEKLAKKLEFHGEILNKIKLKEHAN